MCAASAPEQNSVGDIDGNAEGCVFGIADGGRDTVGKADDVGAEVPLEFILTTNKPFS